MYISCHIEITSEVSLEGKTMPLGTGNSSGIFPFIRNKEIKASIVVLCILFIWLGTAHFLLYIVQRIKVKINAIPVQKTVLMFILKNLLQTIMKAY